MIMYYTQMCCYDDAAILDMSDDDVKDRILVMYLCDVRTCCLKRGLARCLVLSLAV